MFVWLRARTVHAAWQTLWRSPLKLIVIIVCWTVLLGGAYLLALRGLRFLFDEAGVGPFLLDRLWYLFLFVVSLMLLVSQTATAYSTMIRSPETSFWMGLPFSSRWILRAKWWESSGYSAWAVVLLVVPIGLACLTVLHQPFWMLGWLLVILVPLVAIATALSTLLLLLWLRWVRFRVMIRREVIVAGCVLVSVVLFWVIGERQAPQRQDVWFLVLQELLPRMQVATSMWLPSSWTARALSAGWNQRWVEASVYAGLLWSTALVAGRLLDHLAAWWLMPVLRHHAAGYYDGHLASPEPSAASCDVAPGSSARFRIRRWMTRPLLSCVAKDVLLFVRDPIQWSQGLVFFGLLGAYFANIRRFAHLDVEPSWRIGIASLNLACTLLVFGSLAVRFVFPQMSLEGRRLWLLRLAPGGVRVVLCAKLVFYGMLGILVIDGLLLLSARRLGVPAPLGWWMAAVGVVTSVTLVAFALGLGSWLLDPSASDPAKIVSSSSGAMALVLMLAYVGVVIWSLVVAWTSWMHQHMEGLVLATAVLLVASVLWGYTPLRRGLSTLERFEW